MSRNDRAVVPFLVAMMLLTGVCNTLLTKYQDNQCVADCDSARPRLFEQPVIQTLQMFIGESGCWLVVLMAHVYRQVRKSAREDGTAYQAVDDEHEGDAEADGEDYDQDEHHMASSQTLVDPSNVVAKPFIDGEAVHERKPLTGWNVMLLALPAVCDICGTTLMNVGLLLVVPSVYQMTRGALVLFVGLFSVMFLKRHLGGWKWASLFIVVLGVAVVGLAGALDKHQSPADLPGQLNPDDDHAGLAVRASLLMRAVISTVEAHTAAQTVIGVLMIAGAQIFTASQFVIEESIMHTYSMEPIQVVGWEGVFGFLFTLLGMGVLHAALGSTKAGRGRHFDAREGFSEIFGNRTIAVTSLLIMISIGGFNFFGLSVTRTISATSRSTIDTCRTLFIWMISLGLGWETFKWLQVLGFILLVYGTSLFNEIVSPPTIAFLRRKRRSVALGNER